MKMNKNLIKIVGLVATAIGMAATIITDWVNDKKMDEKIEEKVNEAFANQENNDEDES